MFKIGRKLVAQVLSLVKYLNYLDLTFHLKDFQSILCYLHSHVIIIMSVLQYSSSVVTVVSVAQIY